MTLTQILAAGPFDASIQRPWWSYLLWIALTAIAGWVVSFLFSGMLHLPRKIFLIPYVILTGSLVSAFFWWSGISLADLIAHNWIWGLVGALLFGAFVVRNIFSQPASQRSKGLPLVIDILWSGMIYGLMDALLLSVLPVLAVTQSFATLGWTSTLPWKIGVGIIALIASLIVTACYHLGYPEYRGKRGIIGPSIGNGVMTLAYILTNNPMAAIFSHMAMHIAGVLRGPASVMQLPPHYGPSKTAAAV